MGGVGSGGHNRKSAEQHKRLGNFRPSRHARGELVQLRGGLADLPEPPAGLGEAGLQLWRDAWSTMPWLRDVDRVVLRVAAEEADLVEAMRRRFEETGDPGDALAAEVLARGLRQSLALLGVSARDRASMAVAAATVAEKVQHIERAEWAAKIRRAT